MDFFYRSFIGKEIHQRKIAFLCQEIKNSRNLVSASFLIDWDPKRKKEISAKRVFGTVVENDLQVIVEPAVVDKELSNYQTLTIHLPKSEFFKPEYFERYNHYLREKF